MTFEMLPAMALQHLQGRGGKAQVPQLNHGEAVIF